MQAFESTFVMTGAGNGVSGTEGNCEQLGPWHGAFGACSSISIGPGIVSAFGPLRIFT